MPEIKVYISSVAGNLQIKKNIQKLTTILQGNRIDYKTVDIALPENESEKEVLMKALDNKLEIPVVLVDGVRVGNFEQIEEANEYGTLKELLKVA